MPPLPPDRPRRYEDHPWQRKAAAAAAKKADPTAAIRRGPAAAEPPGGWTCINCGSPTCIAGDECGSSSGGM